MEGSGAEAIAQYTRRVKNLDLVITDMLLPFMNGRAVIANQSDLPICAWLARPFSVAQLPTTVSGVLSGSPLEEAVAEKSL